MTVLTKSGQNASIEKEVLPVEMRMGVLSLSFCRFHMAVLRCALHFTSSLSVGVVPSAH